MIKMIALVGVILLVCGGAAAAVVMGVIPVPFGPLAEARAAAEKAKPPVTVMYILKERVVNLTDKSASKYLKIAMQLEFIDTKVKEPPKGAAVLAQQTVFAEEMSPYGAIIDDALGSTLSSRSAADLIKPEGKEQLKNDLILNVNRALHDEEKVVNVYFTSFIIQ